MSNVVGNYVYTTTADGYQVMYRHLKYNSCPANIKVGTKVKAGDIIGRMGSTGQSSGPHLHYEMRDPQVLAFNPKPYLGTSKVFGKPDVPAVTPNVNQGTTLSQKQAINVNDKVIVTAAINYDTGGAFKLYYPQYDVIQVKGDRVVIGISSVITAAVDKKYLAKV